jgi:hypothetical protein
MKNYIRLQQKRELGEILSDSFAFIRQNLKPLFRVLVKTSAIPFLILLASQAYYQYIILVDGPQSIFGTGIIALLVLMVATLFYYGFSSATLLQFVRHYEAGKGIVVESEVINHAKASTGNMILLSILVYLLFIVGLVLLIIPGIYLIVPIFLSFPLLILRNLSVGNALSQAFSLCKGNWWVTFGTIFVIGLVLGIASFIFQAPALIFQTAAPLIGDMDFSAGFSSPFTVIYILLTAVGSSASYVFYLIMVIASAFVYYDLDEEQNKTGLKERINQLDAQ